jgi:hypothetical protein
VHRLIINGDADEIAATDHACPSSALLPQVYNARSVRTLSPTWQALMLMQLVMVATPIDSLGSSFRKSTATLLGTG